MTPSHFKAQTEEFREPQELHRVSSYQRGWQNKMVGILNKLSRRGFIKKAAESAAMLTVLGRNAAAAPTNPETYKLTRAIPVERGYDVVVAGGGPAGAAAAICAARLGVKVLLLEAIGSMGGMGTNAYVSRWYSLGDGERMVIGGLIEELIGTLCLNKQVAPDPTTENYKRGNYIDSVGFNPEAVKMLFDKLCHDSGVEVRFFTRVVDADADQRTGRIRGVITNNIEGYRYIAAQTFIDCTGDAVLANLCGVKLRAAGRDTPHIMPLTLCALVADIDYTRFKPEQQQAMVEKAIAENYFIQADRHVPGLFRSGTNTATMNAAHLFNTNALVCRSLSDAIAHGRVLVENYASFYRKYLEGCEQMKVVSTGTLLGVRESRRIVGEYELNYEDFKGQRHFPDQIAIYSKGTDIHPYDLSTEQYKRYLEEFTVEDRLKRGENYGIPYGILVPKGWANLWVAGRCTSSDIKVNGAIRDQPACSMMGQAAGTAAVQSIHTGQPADDLDTAQLVLTLRKAGANLPQQSLSKTMTRASPTPSTA